MVSRDTLNRAKRRSYIYDIITNLIKVYALPDNKIKILPMIKLNNIRMDTLDFLKWLDLEYRETHDTYIPVFGGDATPTTLQKNRLSLNDSESRQKSKQSQ